MNMPCFPQGITVFGGNGSCPRIQINQEMFTILGFQEINEKKVILRIRLKIYYQKLI
jgi:hypothetical protein